MALPSVTMKLNLWQKVLGNSNFLNAYQTVNGNKFYQEDMVVEVKRGSSAHE